METLASVPGSHKLGMPTPNLQEPGTEAMETSVLFDTSHCCGHIGIHANYRKVPQYLNTCTLPPRSHIAGNTVLL